MWKILFHIGSLSLETKSIILIKIMRLFHLSKIRILILIRFLLWDLNWILRLLVSILNGSSSTSVHLGHRSFLLVLLVYLVRNARFVHRSLELLVLNLRLTCQMIHLHCSHVVLLLRNTWLNLSLLHFCLNNLLFLNLIIYQSIFLNHILWNSSSKVHWFALNWIFSRISAWIFIYRMWNVLLNILENLIRATSVSWPFSSFTYSLLRILRNFLIASIELAPRNPLSWIISFFNNVSILTNLFLILGHYIAVLFLLYWLL
jgi:hypothetical protein